MTVAASLRSSTRVMSRSDADRMERPSSAFVPNMRTTIGQAASVAIRIPLAATSQRRMPPKMLTSTVDTLPSDKTILSASATLSSSAAPPTSRKFAGAASAVLITSIVAIARPAPLTMQPTSPSSLT